MDYMSKSQCIKAATIDAPLLSTDVGKYISQNSFQYYLICNTWIAMVRHYNRSGAIFLTDAIMSQGLIDCIKPCDIIASVRKIHLTE